MQLGIALLFACSVAGTAAAQEAAPAESPPPEVPAPPRVIDPAEIAGAAERAEVELRHLRSEAEPDADSERIEAAREKRTNELNRRAGAAEERLEHYVSLDTLDDMTSEWTSRARRLAEDREALTERARSLDEEIGRLDEMKALWERSQAEARESDAPPAVLSRAQAVLAAIANTREVVQQRRSSVLTVQNGVAQHEAIVVGVLDAVGAARSEERGRLFERDAPPFWDVFGERAPKGTLRERLETSAAHQRSALWDFAQGRGSIFAFHLGLFLFTLISAMVLRARAEAWAEQDANAVASVRVLRRPASAALVVALLAMPWLYPDAPNIVGDIAILAVVVPLLRLLPERLSEGLRVAVFALVVLFVLDRLRDVLDALPLIERCLIGLESLGGAAVLAWLLRRRDLPQRGWMLALAILLRVGLLLFVAAFVANLVGNLNLARLLLTGTLASYLIAVILTTAAQIFDGLVAVVLRTGAAQRLRMVRNHGPLMRRRGFSLVHAAMVVWWGWLSLRQFSLQEAFAAGIRSTVNASISLGAIEISFGKILLFFLTIWGTFLFSRFLRFALNEDVMPRLSLPRGVPYAVSYMLHYGLLLLGFLLATAAAGFDLSSLTLLAGALGVGIGFGLQNIVNNFISGLILLFERPVQVGDTIQVTDLVGEVRRIGIRSSTVRTWQGAEVIVPNANLISEQVVNWTLSDRERRIEVPVGVAYGTDPEQVLALLLEVATKHEDIIEHPPPTALFTGFGDSSLDFELRVWTRNAAEWMRIRSDISVAINRGLKEAGIEIPFPQRDLHLKSVEPGVAGLAPGPGRDSEPEPS